MKDFKNWVPEDITLYNSIDWAARNYEEYDTGESIIDEIVLYGPEDPPTKFVEMHKFIRPNPIYPPYYKAIEEKPFHVDFTYVGPMYDGDKEGPYDIHNRYESSELYDILTR